MKKRVIFLCAILPMMIGCQRNRVTDAVGEGDFYNYPNPFSDKTTIRYIPAKDTFARVSIYTLAGDLVKDFPGQSSAAHQIYDVMWDGRNSSNNEVADGTYTGVLRADGGNRKIRMSRIK